METRTAYHPRFDRHGVVESSTYSLKFGSDVEFNLLADFNKITMNGWTIESTNDDYKIKKGEQPYFKIKYEC